MSASAGFLSGFSLLLHFFWGLHCPSPSYPTLNNAGIVWSKTHMELVTTNSLLLTRCLTYNINSRFTHILYYILWSYNRVSWRKENVNTEVPRFVCKFFQTVAHLHSFPVYLLGKTACKRACAVQTRAVHGAAAVCCFHSVGPDSQ